MSDRLELEPYSWSSRNEQVLLKIEKIIESGCEVYEPSLKRSGTMDHVIKMSNPKRENHATRNLVEPANESAGQFSESKECLGGKNSSNNNDDDVKTVKPPPKRARVSPPEVEVPVTYPSDLEDECLVFGRHVALQLRQLQALGRVVAMDKIQSLLSGYRKVALRARVSPPEVEVPCTYPSDLEDECLVFGRHVALQLRQLPTLGRVVAMDNIQSVLSGYRKVALRCRHDAPLDVDTSSSDSSSSTTL